MKLGRLAVAGLVVLLGALPATAQVAESCTFDEATATVTAVVAPGGEATLEVVAGEIAFGADPQPCGGATNVNTDTIRIAGHEGSAERLILDQRTGPFGPGASLDNGAHAEIEIYATLGDAADNVVLFLTEGDDDAAPGIEGIGLNSDGDTDVVFVDAQGTPIAATFPLEFNALGGDDYVNGRGQFGAGLAYLGALTIHGGNGNERLIRGSAESDVLLGGAGDDLIEGNAADDLLNGGGNDDQLIGGGGDDRLIGGPGADIFIGGGEDDVFHAIDLAMDTSMNGGPGTDTAYYDSGGVDPEPLFVENLFAGDATPPEISCDPPDGSWHGNDVAVSCTAEDPESLLADPTEAAFTLETDLPDGSESANAETGTREVCNSAGLCATAGPVAGNKVDKKAPANPADVSSTTHPPGKWARAAEVSVQFSPPVDGGSGADGISYSWTQSATSIPGQVPDVEETATGLTSPALANGSWFLHLRTVDAVGNWSDAAHHGPYLVDGARPEVRANAGRTTAGRRMKLRYRTADNNNRTRERITVRRAGSVVASWNRPLAAARWDRLQSVRWTPNRRGPYRFCVRAWDEAGNTRASCARLA